MELSEQTIDAALKRGQDLAKAEHRAVGARLDAARGRLAIEFDNGVEMSTPISLLSPTLAGADNKKLADVRLEGGGYDLYWPALDEGLFIPELCAEITYGKLAA
ncbi:MAG: DUF2442 domain-containing protein [Betaproteobacteria bacterium]|nr:DUF2442 domain-containing protein [Betaproteobacteria bacterium]